MNGHKIQLKNISKKKRKYMNIPKIDELLKIAPRH